MGHLLAPTGGRGVTGPRRSRRKVRRETMVSTLHYMVDGYSDFDTPLDIAPPVAVSPRAAPARQFATQMDTPVA